MKIFHTITYLARIDTWFVLAAASIATTLAERPWYRLRYGAFSSSDLPFWSII